MLDSRIKVDLDLSQLFRDYNLIGRGDRGQIQP